MAQQTKLDRISLFLQNEAQSRLTRLFTEWMKPSDDETNRWEELLWQYADELGVTADEVFKVALVGLVGIKAGIKLADNIENDRALKVLDELRMRRS